MDHVRELVAELHRLGQHNRRLYLGIITLLALTILLVGWQAIGMLVAFLGRSGAPVSRRIMVAGAPLAAGLISFHDAEGTGDGKPVAGAAVVGGRYEIAAPPGLKPGRYVVRIRSPRVQSQAGVVTPPAEEMIPAKFNDESSLIIEVRRFGWNRFDFAVP
jgi:hypothetical protein